MIEIEVVCAWCGKVMHTKFTCKEMIANISHGICDSCRKEVIAQFRKELLERTTG